MVWWWQWCQDLQRVGPACSGRATAGGWSPGSSHHMSATPARVTQVTTGPLGPEITIIFSKLSHDEIGLLCYHVGLKSKRKH